MAGQAGRGWSTAARVVAGAAIASAIAVSGAACGTNEDTSGEISVIATTTMLGDVTGDIMECAGGTARTLMPVGADPHDFAPSSADLTAMVKADLVVTNGLGLEEGLADALANAQRDGATVLEVAPAVDPIPFAAGEDGHEQEHGEEHAHEAGTSDPHFWHDARRMAKAATVIAAAIGQQSADPERFERCGAQAADALNTVDAQVRTILEPVRQERRVLITDHHAFGYFAQAYGFEVAGVVVPGGSTLGAPSSADLTALVDTIKLKQVPVLFSNTALSSDLIETVAQEAGTQVTVVPLFVGSLGDKDSGAQTYQAMVTTNAQRIAGALAG
ncbi:MAG: zinc ABC transporter substrate-binding protein [Micromonosporaceae bacterium]|nr:zinc ABC transporter substrate-binding protein [Micromonosporaceae bacterium]